MRGFLIPAAIAAAVSFAVAPAAFAAQAATASTVHGKPMAAKAHVTTGVVTVFDASTHMLKLKNGATYMLPATFKDPGIKVGSKVRVSWNMEKGKHEANKVTVTR